MAETTASMEQQTDPRAQREQREQRVRAARAYQKTHLTEDTEEELLQTYAPVISQMVHRFAPLVRVAVDVDDLKNIASLALIQAAHGYDPGQGMSFQGYARMRIRGAILDEIRKSQPLTRTEYSRRKELEGTIETLRIELNRQPTEEEIAGRMGLEVAKYRQLLDKLRPVIFVPLHQMLEGEDEFGGGSHEFNSADLNQEDPSEQAGRHELHELIRDRIQQLNRQQQKVLLLFYYEGLRMKDIAELLNVSESRVCQVNTEAVLSLRAFLQRREQI